MYKTIIFDMDGVITSEERYWDAASYTVAEYRGIPYKTPDVMRNQFFCENRLITLLKERGVNANWDLVYLTVAFMEDDSEAFYNMVSKSDLRAFQLYDMARERLADYFGRPAHETDRTGALWYEMQASFEEWFLGSALYTKYYGKKAGGGRSGLMEREVPIVGLPALLETLIKLKEKGIRLCIGTARPYPEAMAPLENWGILDFFEKDGVITYTHILEAEAKTKTAGLTKPHPYSFIKAYFGCDFEDAKIINGQYENDFRDVLICGDAGADLFAAKAMGADFAAVLTGVSKEAARPYFIENHATYILEDITKLPLIF